MRIQFSSTLMIALGGLLASCSSQRPYFTEAEISTHGYGSSKSGIEILYSTPSDDLYYCPGVMTVREGSRLNVFFPRCALGETRHVDVPAGQEPSGESIVRIPLRYPEDLPVKVCLNGRSFLFEWRKPTYDCTKVPDKTLPQSADAAGDC